MYDFPSIFSYHDFASRVKTRERFSQSTEVRTFLSAVTATSSKRLKYLAEGTVLWRAQLGCDWIPADQMGQGYEVPMPRGPDRMVPLKAVLNEGRINPVGIPVLYLATNEATAIAEVRAWVGKNVSVAQFKATRHLRVLDCSSDKPEDPHFSDEPPDPAAVERAVWGDINRAFSQPASNEDDRTTYIPTQMLAEHFRSLGANGVVYNSSLGDGKNIALFELDAADIMNCALYLIRGVKFEYDEISSPYYISKHYRK